MKIKTVFFGGYHKVHFFQIYKLNKFSKVFLKEVDKLVLEVSWPF